MKVLKEEPVVIEGKNLVFTVPVPVGTTVTGMSLVTKRKFGQLQVILGGGGELIMETHYHILQHTSPFEIPRQGSDILQIRPNIFEDPTEFWKICSRHEKIEIVLHMNQDPDATLYATQVIQ